MMKQIAIIADDLTGANDSGIQLTEKGINTSVLFQIPKKIKFLSEGVVIDTNSRALSREKAISVTTESAKFIKNLNYMHVYKKMDSTLRGHIGHELQAMGNVLEARFIVVIPAFPEMGRITRDGYHYVHGKLISETEIAKDPKHPVTESHIPSLIEKQIDEKVGLITKEDLESDKKFQEKLEIIHARNIRIICCDAETEKDLKNAAKKFIKETNQIIWAGSAGLAEVLPEMLGIEKEKQSVSYEYSNFAMTVCGSLSEKTQVQVNYALHQPGVEGIELNPLYMFQKDWEEHKATYQKACMKILAEEKDIVLYVPSNEDIRSQVKETGMKLGLSNNEIGETISARIAELVVDIKSQFPKLDRFVLTGGDTAKAITQKLGAIGLHLIKQVEPGIPLVSLIGENESLVITKAGAFGKKDSIYHAMMEMKGEEVYE
ncbi:four-carbon acid sugar kinase family protein [Oceanobacillus sp. J11TS1]|uniref:four-carbon acid sugar kinase family protein n=1 Tax=Oceanobacillus sp. J11TS1 TaxID=2807191 RepID=UPI001AFD6584|nr:four-carbon acid sugar kinase family protein [Oceanobacillus sp. J11TS1]GIO21533.1 membrane protein [Oceanobacillus sp. J11TS1]